ncbi:MAG: LTA synthase family protein [Bacteroidales bacterium]|nr:LTA synthase family protein [Bacteroidales bacterium]
MKRYPPSSPLIVLIVRFLVLMALFLLTRFIFYWFNRDAFEAFTSPIFWQGLRFDAAAICILNAPYFLLLLLPFRFIESRTFRTIGNVYFILVNSIALLTNLIDTCYYSFSMRRMTGDIFSFIEETNNFGELVPVFIKDYWYIGAIWLGIIGILCLTSYLTEKTDYHWLISKCKYVSWKIGHWWWLFISLVFADKVGFDDELLDAEGGAEYSEKPSGWFKHIVFRAFCIFLIVVGARGGLQMRPLSISYACGAAGVENAALVLNTPYSLVTTLGATEVKRVSYFSEERCAEIFDTKRNIRGHDYYETGTNFPKYGKAIDYDHPINIVLIILEGISSEYSDYLADEPKALGGCTPFLDSLAQNAIVFRGYANGQQSIEALSSIIGGIPSLMDKPFSQSPYSVYDLTYPATLLSGNYGKLNMFFHGGKNGTMGFDRYCRIAGIGSYFGMDEYPDEEDYDGTWGIKDMPYLQYVAKRLRDEPKPFFATIFTLSSHHPFVVPDGYDTLLSATRTTAMDAGDGGTSFAAAEPTPMQHCVAYTDEALRQFFHTAKNSYWYENTLFVITADHTNFYGAENVDYLAHRYSVPMIFYWPKNPVSYRSDRIVQQVDIMPSIFDFCNMQGTFTSFGHSAFNEKAPHFAINYLSGNYHFYTGHFLFEFNGKEITHIWDLQGGSHEVGSDDVPDFSEREQLMKAVIQRYNNGLRSGDW